VRFGRGEVQRHLRLMKPVQTGTVDQGCQVLGAKDFFNASTSGASWRSSALISSARRGSPSLFHTLSVTTRSRIPASSPATIMQTPGAAPRSAPDQARSGDQGGAELGTEFGGFDVSADSDRASRFGMDSSDPGVDLREVLGNLSYPADKWQIVACAEVYGFDYATRRTLHALPVRRYSDPAEVVSVLGPLETDGGQR
jgi:hypothetical protein